MLWKVTSGFSTTFTSSEITVTQTFSPLRFRKIRGQKLNRENERSPFLSPFSHHHHPSLVQLWSNRVSHALLLLCFGFKTRGGRRSDHRLHGNADVWLQVTFRQSNKMIFSSSWWKSFQIAWCQDKQSHFLFHSAVADELPVFPSHYWTIRSAAVVSYHLRLLSDPLSLRWWMLSALLCLLSGLTVDSCCPWQMCPHTWQMAADLLLRQCDKDLQLLADYLTEIFYCAAFFVFLLLPKQATVSSLKFIVLSENISLKRSSQTKTGMFNKLAQDS